MGKWLLDPLAPIPEAPGFQLDADISALPFKGPGRGGSARHPDLAHDRMQIIVPIRWLEQYLVACFDQASSGATQWLGGGRFRGIGPSRIE